MTSVLLAVRPAGNSFEMASPLFVECFYVHLSLNLPDSVVHKTHILCTDEGMKIQRAYVACSADLRYASLADGTPNGNTRKQYITKGEL